MSNPHFNPASDESVESAAAQWLARHDRGFTAREQSDHAAWLRADARHETAFLRLERTWQALDRLAVDPAFQVTPPNPDLLVRRRSQRQLWIWAPLLAAAAAIVMVYLGRPVPTVAPVTPQAIVHPAPQRLNLEDGSVVELNTGAKVEVTFTPNERRVRLARGEAYFTVAKNPARPFIVSANQVTVRAVGTAFSVGLAPREVSVLVTEGRVRVDEVVTSGDQTGTVRALSALGAGQQGIVTFATLSAGAKPAIMTVTELSAAEIEHALFWRGLRLEFAGMPLGDVVTEFNRYNQKKLVVHDATTAAIRVGGNFRADNVEAFVRLLDVGFGVSAFPVNGELVLRKTHGP